MDTTVRKKSTVSSQHLGITQTPLSSHLQPTTRVICARECIPRGLLQENVIPHTSSGLWYTYYGQATKASQGKQLASAPYKHHLHGKDPVLITHNITA